MTTATSTAAVLMTQLCKNRTVFWVWALTHLKTARKMRHRRRKNKERFCWLPARIPARFSAAHENHFVHRGALRRRCQRHWPRRHRAGRHAGKTRRRFYVHRRPDVRQTRQRLFRRPAQRPHHGVERGRQTVHVHAAVRLRERHDVRRATEISSPAPTSTTSSGPSRRTRP